MRQRRRETAFTNKGVRELEDVRQVVHSVRVHEALLPPMVVHYCEVYNITFTGDVGLIEKFHFDKRMVKKILHRKAKEDI